MRSLKTEVDVVVISRMFGQKIKEAEHGLGTISDWAGLGSINPGSPQDTGAATECITARD